MGPVDQLGSMLPADFRRLAPTPAEAAQKIEDILTALQTTSFEDRVKGVGAWRESPINQLYLAMANEALNAGITLTEVASKLRSKGGESLSPAEIRAIAALNNRIRF